MQFFMATLALATVVSALDIRFYPPGAQTCDNASFGCVNENPEVRLLYFLFKSSCSLFNVIEVLLSSRLHGPCGVARCSEELVFQDILWTSR